MVTGNTLTPNSNAGRRLLTALNPVALFVELWKCRALITQFTKREIEGRYKGSHLGLLWSFITPLLMLLIYTFVFGIVFKARWRNVQCGNDLIGFALILFAGQISFNLFAEPAARGPGLIVGVPNFVKKVVFPLHIIPVSIVGAAAFHGLIAMGILVAASLFILGSVPWTLALVPLAVLPLLLLGLGCAWFLAALGVYIRDIGYAVNVVIQMLFFATPIFYPKEQAAQYQYILDWNPLTHMVELVRGCAILGKPGTPSTWALVFALGIAAALIGHGWFVMTRKGFADVL